MQIVDKKINKRQQQYTYNGDSKKSNDRSDKVLIKNQL